mgnify:CR=1 FL=1
MFIGLKGAIFSKNFRDFSKTVCRGYVISIGNIIVLGISLILCVCTNNYNYEKCFKMAPFIYT